MRKERLQYPATPASQRRPRKATPETHFPLNPLQGQELQGAAPTRTPRPTAARRNEGFMNSWEGTPGNAEGVPANETTKNGRREIPAARGRATRSQKREVQQKTSADCSSSRGNPRRLASNNSFASRATHPNYLSLLKHLVPRGGQIRGPG